MDFALRFVIAEFEGMAEGVAQPVEGKL